MLNANHTCSRERQYQPKVWVLASTTASAAHVFASLFTVTTHKGSGSPPLLHAQKLPLSNRVWTAKHAHCSSEALKHSKVTCRCTHACMRNANSAVSLFEFVVPHTGGAKGALPQRLLLQHSALRQHFPLKSTVPACSTRCSILVPVR